jgi:protein-S-isoprenylcysteine O-methyltransferase Ste14
MTALKTLLWSVLVPGTVAVLVLRWLLSSRFTWPDLAQCGWRCVGLVPILLGVALYLWCAWGFTFVGKGTPAPFDPPKKLVARGPYRFVRNPMYLAVLLIVGGQALLFLSAELIAYAALLFPGFHLWVIFYEEPTLRRKFGDSYKQYCQAVPRWIPKR